jgi:hypothetical protein
MNHDVQISQLGPMRWLAPAAALAFFPSIAFSQVGAEQRPRRTGPSVQADQPASPVSRTSVTSNATGSRPVILVTGYWPPTNEAVRRFSQDPVKNPGGWQGSDWMGSGYDIVSYFPEFANPNCNNCGVGMGDLTVDYQDTTADFEVITDQHRPIAILTLSRGFPGNSWEVESNQFNRNVWFDDFIPPRMPDMTPPDSSLDPDALRLTALPAQEIVDAVSAANVGVSPFICYTQSGGAFLSEYIAYLGVWYQARHNDPTLPDWCVTAGHVHVGVDVTWPAASAAVDVTLGTIVDYMDRVRSCPPIVPYCEGLPNSESFGAQLSAVGSPSIAADELQLLVQRVPRNTAGIAFYGPSRANGPLGNGILCVGGSLYRLPIPGLANNVTAMILPLDFTSFPLAVGPGAVTPGSTWNIQVWYRDVGVGPGTNTTNALEVTFCL